MTDDLVYTPNGIAEKESSSDKSEEKPTINFMDQSLDDYISEKRKNRTSDKDKEGKTKNIHKRRQYIDPHPKVIPLHLSDREISKLLTISNCDVDINEKASLQVVLSKKHY